jgi:hypothetical protein
MRRPSRLVWLFVCLVSFMGGSAHAQQNAGPQGNVGSSTSWDWVLVTSPAGTATRIVAHQKTGELWALSGGNVYRDSGSQSQRWGAVSGTRSGGGSPISGFTYISQFGDAMGAIANDSLFILSSDGWSEYRNDVSLQYTQATWVSDIFDIGLPGVWGVFKDGSIRGYSGAINVGCNLKTVIAPGPVDQLAGGWNKLMMIRSDTVWSMSGSWCQPPVWVNPVVSTGVKQVSIGAHSRYGGRETKNRVTVGVGNASASSAVKVWGGSGWSSIPGSDNRTNFVSAAVGKDGRIWAVDNLGYLYYWDQYRQ